MHINNLYFCIKPNTFERVVLNAQKVHKTSGLKSRIFILTTNSFFPLRHITSQILHFVERG